MRHDAPRILYCTDTYPPQVNGVSVVTAVTVKGMQERGWECAVVSPQYPKPYGQAFASDAPDLSAVQLHVKLRAIALPQYPDIRLSAPLYGQVSDAVRRFRPQLVHCQTEFVVGRMGQLAAARHGVPTVSSYHTDFSRYTESYGVGRMRALVSRYIGRFHRRSRRVYTPSESARDDLHRFGVRNVEVWGRGVNVDQFSPGMWSGALREQLGVGDDFVFLYVGRLAPEKNVELVLESFRLLRDAHPGRRVKLVVAGDGPSTPALRARAAEGIQFLGNLERRFVLPLLYASADAFVYASETETLGLVVLEAMASRIPVIATPAGGVAVNLRHEVNGLAFPPGDAAAMASAMSRILTDSALRRQLASGARKWAEERSWRVELDRLNESYREVLNESAMSSTRSARSPDGAEVRVSEPGAVLQAEADGAVHPDVRRPDEGHGD